LPNSGSKARLDETGLRTLLPNILWGPGKSKNETSFSSPYSVVEKDVSLRSLPLENEEFTEAKIQVSKPRVKKRKLGSTRAQDRYSVRSLQPPTNSETCDGQEPMLAFSKKSQTDTVPGDRRDDIKKIAKPVSVPYAERKNNPTTSSSGPSVRPDRGRPGPSVEQEGMNVFRRKGGETL